MRRINIKAAVGPNMRRGICRIDIGDKWILGMADPGKSYRGQ